ncbi:hypothetical protein BGZ76_000767 [Entomortierella beljakovae]|nr:hypothetical protein BGZ76_000767 [Entomortierella beljakovae]
MKSFSSELPYFCLFLISLWLSGTIFEEFLQCRLLGELLIGVIFGNLNHLLPDDKSVLILVGEVGVLGLIFEAGLGTNLRKVLRAGPRSTLIALAGTIIPLSTGFGFIYAISSTSQFQIHDPNSYNVNVIIEALASGAALASTSIACAVSMMKQRGMLETYLGTLITTAAMIDDVISLVLLSIISSIGSREPGDEDSSIEPMSIVQPIVASIGVIAFGLIICVVKERFVDRRQLDLPNHVQEPDLELDVGMEQDFSSNPSKDQCSVLSADEAYETNKARSHYNRMKNRFSQIQETFLPTLKMAAMIISSIGFSILAEYLGSSRLLGAFVAGVFFSSFRTLTPLYRENIEKTLQPALNAIFFATIGFAIPLSKILDATLFGWGVLYAVIGAVSKLVTAFLVPSSTGGRYDRWVVGTAMIARGELGLLMVQQALLQGVMEQSVMIVTTWSIILCTVVGIGSLGFVLNKI